MKEQFIIAHIAHIIIVVVIIIGTSISESHTCRCVRISISCIQIFGTVVRVRPTPIGVSG